MTHFAERRNSVMHIGAIGEHPEYVCDLFWNSVATCLFLKLLHAVTMR